MLLILTAWQSGCHGGGLHSTVNHGLVVDLIHFSSSLVFCELCTCGMMVSLDLRSCRPISAIFTSSTVISPAAASSSLKRQSVMEDLPAPVRPTIPICAGTHTQLWLMKPSRRPNIAYWLPRHPLSTFSPPLTFSVSLFRTRSSPSL